MVHVILLYTFSDPYVLEYWIKGKYSKHIANKWHATVLSNCLQNRSLKKTGTGLSTSALVPVSSLEIKISNSISDTHELC